MTLTMEEAQELRGLRVIVGNLYTQIADGWHPDKKANEQLRASEDRLDELERK